MGFLAGDGGDWFWTTFLSSIVIWVFCLVSGSAPVSWVLMHKLTTLYIVVGYLCLGVTTALLRFYRKSKKVETCELVIESDYLGDDRDYVIDRTFNRLKQSVSKWIAFWPYVLIWDILSDFLKSFFDWITEKLNNILKRIFLYAVRLNLAKVKEEFKLNEADIKHMKELF
jgi:hypothetical protein